MKKSTLISSLTAVMICASLMTSSASAAVSTFGKWPSRYNTMYIANSSIGSPWASSAGQWYSNTNYKLSTSIGTSSNYYAYNVSNSSADWDGTTYTSYSGGVITSVTLNLNTFYTQGSRYTSNVLRGVLTHEIGHSLGLNESSVVETSSVMYPYTFYSDGTTPQRVFSPSASDIAVVNSLYPALGSLSDDNKSQNKDSEIPQLEDRVYIYPSWAVHYEDEAALTKAADLVIKGKVTENKGSKFIKGDYLSYTTEVSVDTTEILKGDTLTEKSIVVSQMGGDDGDVTVFSEETTHLKKDQDVILFLRKNADGTFRPINEDDGIFINESGQYKNINSGNLL
ncbi:matrixin family metalloprotease [Paenibacillus sonchi]|uniref:matrixin family metalloprotease n=1 Tax=Paenibacillus sonchi TaxID=373687 RepID=UPI001E659B10|nr:matrixin family metalloprotease [Paenibacillus sonchi]MCE3202812.1 matrixin family metalloprotease [Paenibacillus sonchi]